MKKIYEWLVRSSANPANISLTVKSAIPFLMLFGVDKVISPDEVDAAAEGIVALIVSAGMFLTALTTLFGLGRKVVLSFK